MNHATLSQVLGQTPFEFFDETDSTMTRAKEWVTREPSLPAGAVVVADYQREGRGRHGKPPWLAPKGHAVLMTLIYPDLDSPEQFWQASGIAVQESLRRYAVSPSIKWPNDVLLGGRKVAGCLVEHTPRVGNSRGFTYVGIGVNVYADFSGTVLAEKATSLCHHTALGIDRPGLVAEIASQFSRWLGHGALHDEWVSRLETIGQRVSVETNHGMLVGIAEGVTPDGNLVLRLDDGTTRMLHEGYVSHLRRAGNAEPVAAPDPAG